MAEKHTQRSILKKVLLRLRRYWAGLVLSLILAVIHVVMTLYIPILVGDAIDCIVEAGNVDFAQMGIHLRNVALCAVAAALALSLGIALQNLPEGAIISMPLHSGGMKKGRAFAYGVLSGIVEPLGALLTILLAGIMVPILPYTLTFAAGAMLYVVVEELVPEMSEGEHSHIGVLCFALGFTLMMVLDVALG